MRPFVRAMLHHFYIVYESRFNGVLMFYINVLRPRLCKGWDRVVLCAMISDGLADFWIFRVAFSRLVPPPSQPYKAWNFRNVIILISFIIFA